MFNSNTKVGQIKAAPPKPKEKKPRDLDSSFWKEYKEKGSAHLASSDSELPSLLVFGLGVLGAKPETEQLRLSNASIRDAHLPALIEALHHSECGLRRLDLGFNRLTDQGLRELVVALCRKLTSHEGFACCAFDLTHLFVGGNALTREGNKECQRLLRSAGREVLFDSTPLLRDAQPLCWVGQVFDASPASVAGLQQGDKIIAFGAYHTPKEPTKGYTTNPQRYYDAFSYYLDVSRSIAPLVKQNVGKPIDVVVQRVMVDKKDGDEVAEAAANGETSAPVSDAGSETAARTEHISLTLVPKIWGGAGLIGCKLMELAENKY